MAIDWERFRFLCNIDDYANVHVYPTDDVAGDMLAIQTKFRLGMDRRLLPSCRLVSADEGHKPGIAIFFTRRLSDTLLNIGATIDRISSTIADEGMGTPVAEKGNPNDKEA